LVRHEKPALVAGFLLPAQRVDQTCRSELAREAFSRDLDAEWFASKD